MKLTQLVGLALGLVMFGAGSASAKYLNYFFHSGASPATTILYFHKDQAGTTSVAANREEVDEWSFFNSGGNNVNVRAYTNGAPAWRGGTFSPDFTEDYITLRMRPGQTINVRGMTLYGWHVEDDPGSGPIVIMGINR